jgi:hypothetical protein
VSIVFYSHQLAENDTFTVWGPSVIFENVEEYESSPQWRLVRAIWRVRHRRDTACFICGRIDEIDLHHLAYRTIGFDEDWGILDQLVRRCVRITTMKLRSASAGSVGLAPRHISSIAMS